MKFTPIRIAAAAGALALLGTGASLAQPAPDAGPPDRQMMRERPDPAAMAERRIERLRTVLQLTPQQEPALRAFVEAIRPPGDRRARMGEARAEMAGLTTPQRLDRMQARMAERQAMFERRAAATKRFYAQVSPSQQKAFDAMGPMGGRHGKGRMGHGRFGGHDQG